MTTSSPPRREWTRLEPPQVAGLALLLLVIDVAVAVTMLLVMGDVRCASVACRTDPVVSTTRPLYSLGLAVLVIVVPILVACWRRRGLRTTVLVQLVAGAVLIALAVDAVTTAQATKRDPGPILLQPSLRPCAATTLAGFTCLTYSETPPPEPVGSP